MSTNIRPSLSEKNKWWIEKHRYYELRHFCLQYPTWKKAYAGLDSLGKRPTLADIFSKSNIHGDPTAKTAEARMFFRDRIDMVERAATMTDPVLAKYIVRAVTEGLSYSYLKARLEIPCSKEVYYELYRKFFWLLSKARN